MFLRSLLQPSSGTNALPVQLDSQGRVKYDALVKQGHRKDKVTDLKANSPNWGPVHFFVGYS